MQLTRRTLLNCSDRFVDFPVKDRLGRVIGARVYFATALFEIPEHPEAGWRMPPGEYYAMRTQATRNGLAYGPSQEWSYFETIAQRDAALAKYLRGATARAMKHAKAG